MLVAGIARLGFVADLLSKPTQIGYMNGLALTILVGQLPKLFGFSVDADGLIDEARGFVDGVQAGRRGRRRRRDRRGQPRADPRACGAWLPTDPRRPRRGRRSRSRRRPRSTSATTACRSSGRCPQGFPPLTLPSAGDDLPLLVAGAVGIALVALADTISTASAFAARTGQEVDGNGEMIGIGAANVAAGALPGLPGEHERLAHRGRRAGGREDAADRRRRRGGDRADARARARACCATSRSRRSRPS